ncbi:hypothetical protein D5S18_07700 [Nocardia panacis]|uniref:DUF4254 domain-containing protein n=1 Tax=Nocardia panacis TaxID=2340916 RepID=A0A3A4KPY4_9NOCA|nr:hypothetical protein D5S18_07700 [Nocardia panacis]
MIRARVIHVLLPGWRDLEGALQGRKGNSPGDPLLLRWAQSLGHLHRTRHINPARSTEIDCRRIQLVELMATWAEMHLKLSNAIAPQVGQKIDALADAYVHGEMLMLSGNATEHQIHAGWSRTAQLMTEWADYVALVEYGQPLPPWPVKPAAPPTTAPPSASEDLQ